MNKLFHTFSDKIRISGTKWFGRFLNRLPKVSTIWTTANESRASHDLNRFIISDHFTKLKDAMKDTEVMYKQKLSYTTDEKGYCFTLHQHQTVLGRKFVGSVDSVNFRKCWTYYYCFLCQCFRINHSSDDVSRRKTFEPGARWQYVIWDHCCDHW
jgi:hypothetical protein